MFVHRGRELLVLVGIFFAQIRSCGMIWLVVPQIFFRWWAFFTSPDRSLLPDDFVGSSAGVAFVGRRSCAPPARYCGMIIYSADCCSLAGVCLPASRDKQYCHIAASHFRYGLIEMIGCAWGVGCSLAGVRYFFLLKCDRSFVAA